MPGFTPNDELTIEPRDLLPLFGDFNRGLERANAADAVAVRSRALALKHAIETDGDIAGALRDLLALDPAWKKLGIEAGLLDPDGPQPRVVCFGLCIFLAGVVVGTVLGVAVSK